MDWRDWRDRRDWRDWSRQSLQSPQSLRSRRIGERPPLRFTGSSGAGHWLRRPRALADQERRGPYAGDDRRGLDAATPGFAVRRLGVEPRQGREPRLAAAAPLRPRPRQLRPVLHHPPLARKRRREQPGLLSGSSRPGDGGPLAMPGKGHPAWSSRFILLVASSRRTRSEIW